MIKAFNDKTPQLDDTVFVAETAAIIGDVSIGSHSSVWYSAVIRGDMHYVKIGDRTNVQDGAVLHVTHDHFPLNVGSNVTIGHAAVVHGCTVEDNCLIGMNATLLDGSVIGEGSVVAAGALVLEGQEVPPRSLVVGVPAKPIRTLSEEDVNLILESAEEYVKYTRIFISGSESK